MPSSDEAPRRVVASRHEIVRLLGQGGMGTVYEARNVLSGRAEAVKLPRPELARDTSYRKRFLREARAAATLQHPNVIEILDVALDDDGTPVLVMELLDGCSLGLVLERKGRLDVAQTATILVPILDALRAAHERGIFHRDFKPENIFLARRARTMVPKLLDFGIAKVTTIDPTMDTATATGAMFGTPFYMAPEQVGGARDVDHRADVWAAGAVVYECLTGRRPFLGDNFGQIFVAILESKPPDMQALEPAIPDAVAAAVRRALERDRDKRTAGVDELLSALEQHVAPASVGVDLLPTTPSAPRVTGEPSGDATTVVAPAVVSDRAPPQARRAAPTDEEPGAVVPAPAPRRMGQALIGLLLLAGVGVGLWRAGVLGGGARQTTTPVTGASASELIEQAERATGASHWEAAVALGREAVARDPGSVRARLALARALTLGAWLGARGRIEAARQARAELETAIRLAPEQPDAYRQLGVIEYLLGDDLGALEALRTAEQGGPVGDTHWVRGRIFWRMGRRAEARRELDACIRLSADLGCQSVRRWDRELDEGLEAVRTAVADPTVDPKLDPFTRVRLRALLGKTDEASLAFEAAENLGQIDAIDRPHLRGLIAHARGDRTAALAALDEMRRAANDPDALPALIVASTWQGAELAAVLGDVDGALASAERGLEVGFWNADYWRLHFAYERARTDPRWAGMVVRAHERGEARWAEAERRHLVP